MLHKHGEQRGSDRWDRPSMAWVRADQWQVRQWEREDRVFARKANQGQLTAPSIVTDGQGGINGIRSMKSGSSANGASAFTSVSPWKLIRPG